MMDFPHPSGFAPVGLVLLIFSAFGHGSAPGLATSGDREGSQSGRCLPQCGNQTFNPEESTCCKDKGKARLTTLLSQDVSACCGLQAYNPINEICCENSVITKTAARVQCDENDKSGIAPVRSPRGCCGRGQFDAENQCCCGGTDTMLPECRESCTNSTTSAPPSALAPFGLLCCGPLCSKVQLVRKSHYHECCGETDQYDVRTECCFGNYPQVKPLCECKEFSRSSTDAAELYAGDGFGPLCCGPEGSKVLLQRMSFHHQCCGSKQFNRETESCSNSLTPSGCVGDVADIGTDTQQRKQQNQACLSNDCCGGEVYNATTHICCDGHSHTNRKNIPCCGTAASNITKPLKCCKGSLYEVTSNVTTDLCCGSRLRMREETCCRSEDKQRLYSTKAGLECCGHRYYNSSLWSCIETLIPRPRP